MPELTREPNANTPMPVRRRMFLSGVPITKALQPFLPKARDPKPQAKYQHPPEKIPRGKDWDYKPKKRLTKTLSLKDRKKQLAAILRRAGVETVSGYFAKKAG